MPNRAKADYSHLQIPGREPIGELAERMMAGPSPERRQQQGRIRQAVRAAVNQAMLELNGAKRAGYRMPSTDALLKLSFGGLPSWVQRDAREMLDSVRPRFEEGSPGPAREVGNQFAREVTDRLEEEGWAPEAPVLESPTELVAGIPR